MTGCPAAWRTGSSEDVGAAQPQNSALYLPKMPRSANYIAERGNQKNTSFLIFSLYPIFISRNARREVPASCGPND